MSALDGLGLTAAQHARRVGKIGASFVPYLMAADEPKLLTEWQRLVEDPAYVEEDLSERWPVQFGKYIEAFALDWHERRDGRALTRRGESVNHPTLPYVSCTLDAYREEDRRVVDVKAVGKWRKIEDVLAFYPAQLVVQRACVGAETAALLVVHGGGEPEEYPIEWGADYEAVVWERIAWFWACVTDLTPPVAVKPIAAPVPAVRIVDMESSNAWSEWAAKWLANKTAAGTFAEAVKEIKTLMDDDVKQAFGHGITATKDKRGSVTIKGSAT